MCSIIKTGISTQREDRRHRVQSRRLATGGCCDPSWQRVGRIVTKDAGEGTVHTSLRRRNEANLASVTKLLFGGDEVGFHNKSRSGEYGGIVRTVRREDIAMFQTGSPICKIFVFGVGS
jgi:hypothetical protein